jgi:F0F1-type ATP synthase epsilon subunit
MARVLDLSVLTPAETLLAVDDAAWVHLRLADGTGITIYPGHAPLLAETVTAALCYADGTGEHAFNVEAGILQVKGDGVTLFTSGQSEAEVIAKTPTTSQERRFERLAGELRAKLEGKLDHALGDVLDTDDE